MIQVIPIAALKDNYIWCLVNSDKHAIIVDPGDADPVLQFLSRNKFTLSAIWITHHHWDHTQGIEKILAKKNVPVYGSHVSPNLLITHSIKDKQKIRFWNSMEFAVLAIPGHTLDHVAYFGENMLFCGDTLFSAGCGRVFEGTMEQMVQSLEKLKNLPQDTKVFCGHEYTRANLNFAQLVEPNNVDILNRISEINIMQGPTLPSTIALEKMINPFLRLDQDTVKFAVETHAKKSLNNAVEIFTVLREWKNSI